MARSETRRARRRLLSAARTVARQRFRDPDLRLADVAQAVGSSPRQLQRVFQEAGQEDFRSYLLRVRMEHATQLLTRQPNPLSIRQTARRVGFRQASGLRQAFVRYYGYNPSTIQAPQPQYIGDIDIGATPALDRDTRGH